MVALAQPGVSSIAFHHGLADSDQNRILFTGWAHRERFLGRILIPVGQGSGRLKFGGI